MYTLYTHIYLLSMDIKLEETSQVSVLLMAMPPRSLLQKAEVCGQRKKKLGALPDQAARGLVSKHE